MRRQLGFNLIEVMVSLVVISIGLLGVASLQINALQQNHSAYMRSQATQLAYNIVDRMRANPSQVANGEYFAASGASNAACISHVGTVAGCTATEMARHDLGEWQTRIGTELLQGNGRVCRSDLSGDLPGAPDCEADNSANPVVVYVWWQDSRNTNSAAITQFHVSAEL